MSDPWMVAANSEPHCKRCSEPCGDEYLQCHHCGRHVCGGCQSETEMASNSCEQCFPKEVIKLQADCFVLNQQREQAVEKLAEWRERYYKLEQGLMENLGPVACPDTEVVLAARRVQA